MQDNCRLDSIDLELDNCFLDSIDLELLSPSTRMSQAGNGNEESPVPNFKKCIIGKVQHGTQKTKSLFSLAKICKVPEDLRKLNKSAYTPRIIAIGPFHRNDKHLIGPTPLQGVKAYYTDRLFSRLTNGVASDIQNEQKINESLDKMKEMWHVGKAKEYYAAEVKASEDEMFEMMFFDGCFIIELLYASHRKRLKEEREKKTTKNGGDRGNPKVRCWDGLCGAQPSCSNPKPNIGGEERNNSTASDGKKDVDPILDIKLTESLVKQDLLLLENQIPYFVLKDLFELTVKQIVGDHLTGCTCKLPSLTDYVVSYFHHVLNPEAKNCGEPPVPPPKTCSRFLRETVICIYDTTTCYRKEVEQKGKGHENDGGGYMHILHLLHKTYRLGQRGKEKLGKAKYNELPRPASDLDDAGVKFVTGESNDSWKVKFTQPSNCIAWWFHRARFEIPSLYIHDSTEPFLRNLIAFEQCCPTCPEIQPWVTSYAKLMDMLINTEKDVKVLKKAEVVHNYLGKDEDVSDLFNKLCQGVVIGDQFFFNDKCQDAYKYSKHWWPKLIAYWKRSYFDSPWAFRGVCVAIIIFGIQVANCIRNFLK